MSLVNKRKQQLQEAYCYEISFPKQRFTSWPSFAIVSYPVTNPLFVLTVHGRRSHVLEENTHSSLLKYSSMNGGPAVVKSLAFVTEMILSWEGKQLT